MNDIDDLITNPRFKREDSPSFTDLCEQRYSRRNFIKASAALGAGFSAMSCSNEKVSESAIDSADVAQATAKPINPKFDFVEIEHGFDENHLVAPDHEADILIRWGDPLFEDAPEFDVNNQSAENQSKQFGYNNDFISYFALESNEGQPPRALLCVNHEYPLVGLMFPDFGSDKAITKEQVAIAQASVGVSIVEIQFRDDGWQVDRSSKYNRRISALDTQIEITGPAKGHPRLKTSQDANGDKVIGTLYNCAGGMTPWGTYLSCEENFNSHFSGKLEKGHPEKVNHKRYNLGDDYFNWSKHDKRFDISMEPNEPNRFGWVVEIDPFDAQSTPKKRTALGRFKHEGAENVIAKDGRFVIYMGDDQRFEYLYKFVSRDKVDLDNKESNANLLDAGTVYVAKFYDDGHLEWLALDYANPLLSSHFDSQADILIETRRAADLLGATPMDRPEDVVPNAQTGKVYVMLTNNTKRKEANAANPREKNYFGHIIEITEGDLEFSNTTASWDMLVKCGDPNNQKHDAQWNSHTSENGWFASPDNGAIDPQSRLWVSTDQGSKAHRSGTADGLWAMETEGELRGAAKMFFRAPQGAEVCGPAFSDDGENLFIAVQHPGHDESTGTTRIESALTRWPDFIEGKPPRPSIVVVRKKGGGTVG